MENYINGNGINPNIVINGDTAVMNGGTRGSGYLLREKIQDTFSRGSQVSGENKKSFFAKIAELFTFNKKDAAAAASQNNAVSKNVKYYEDFSSAVNNSVLPKEVDVLVNPDAKIRLSDSYILDLKQSGLSEYLESLPEGSIIFAGRSPSCEFTVPENITDVSRQHLAFCREDGKIFVRDLSKNGSSLFDTGIKPPSFVKISSTEAIAREVGFPFGDYTSAVRGSVLPSGKDILVNSDAKFDLGAGVIFDMEKSGVKEYMSKIPEGQPVFVGRSADCAFRINPEYRNVSRQHLLMFRAGDNVFVRDISSYGTKVQDSGMNLNELVRTVGNNGKELNERYIKTSKELRTHFEDAIKNGEYTESFESYVNTVRKAHSLAYKGKSGKDFWYKDHYTGKLADFTPGKIWEREYSVNGYHEAFDVEEIAKRYGDYFRASDGSASKVSLKNISLKALPANEGKSHFYPGSDYMSEYFQQMYKTSKEAVELINKGACEDEILEKIAEHYQYAANARPFRHINNSLFMNEVNTLLKKAGMKTVPHGILDHAAQRLQPETFTRYFKDYYKYFKL